MPSFEIELMSLDFNNNNISKERKCKIIVKISVKFNKKCHLKKELSQNFQFSVKIDRKKVLLATNQADIAEFSSLKNTFQQHQCNSPKI